MSPKFKFLISKAFKNPTVLIISIVAAVLVCFFGSKLLFTDYVARAKILVISGTRGEEDDLAEGKAQVSSRSMKTTSNILKSRTLMEEITAQLNLEDIFGKADAVDRLLKMVTVKPISGTDIIEISVAYKKPELTVHIANEICRVLVAGSTRERFSFEKDMLTWLSSETDILRKNVEDAAAKLRKFSRDSTVADLKTEYEVTSGRIMKLQTSLSAIRAERQEAEASHDNIQNFLEAQTKPEELTEVKNDAEYMELSSEYVYLQKEKGAVLKKYNESHPDIIEMNDKLGIIKSMMAARMKAVIEEARVRHDVFRTREAGLEKIIKEENNRILDLEEKIDKYNSLVNDLKEEESIYNAFVNKTRGGFGGGVSVQKIDLIEQAYLPRHKEVPPLSLTILLGFLIGLVTGGAYNIIRYGEGLISEEEAEPTKNKGMYIERVREESQEEKQ